MPSVSDNKPTRLNAVAGAGNSFWVKSFLAGVGAFLLGYALMAGVFLVSSANTTGPLADRLVLMGHVLYNAHFVPLTSSGGLMVDYLAGASELPVGIYYAVPVASVALVGGAIGRFLARKPERILHAGAALAVGYTAVATTGALTLAMPFQVVGPTISPDLVKAVVFGLAYPVVFGTVGAGVGYALGGLRDR